MAGTGTPLAQRLRARIRRDGPMPFRDWMEACLYDEAEGYYNRPGRKTGAGRDADFVTPPTLHPFFGQAVGRELLQLCQNDGRPESYRVVEVGGGEGDLAVSALEELRRGGVPDVAWSADERSLVHRAAQREKGIPASARGEPCDAMVLCEVLDAVPVDAFGEDGVPVRVAWRDGRFAPTGPIAHTDARGPARWLATRSAGARHVLVIDYGDRRPPAGIRAYSGHQAADPFTGPGTRDITASVDFAAVAHEMAAAGYREASFETLEAFLLRHGILEALNAVDRTTPEGASSYLRLRQLLLPTGLGAEFKVVRFTRVQGPGAPPDAPPGQAPHRT